MRIRPAKPFQGFKRKAFQTYIPMVALTRSIANEERKPGIFKMELISDVKIATATQRKIEAIEEATAFGRLHCDDAVW